MKKSIIVFLLILISAVLISCGGDKEESAPLSETELSEAPAQPEIKAESEINAEPEPNPAITAEPGPVITTEDEIEPEPTSEPELESADEVKTVPPSEVDHTLPPPASDMTKGLEQETQIEQQPPLEAEPEHEPEPVLVAEAVPELPSKPVAEPEPIIETATETAVQDIEIVDTKTPVVSIASPAFGDYYDGTVTVIGYFSGFSSISNAEWELLGTDQKGLINNANNELFSFDIDTSGLDSSLAVSVSATDGNNGKIEDLVVLRNDYSGPGLQITSPSNNSLFANGTVISGRTEPFQKLEAEIIGAGLPFPLQADSSGRFEVPLQEVLVSSGTDDLEDSSVIVKISAADVNNNISTDYICLLKKDSGHSISLTSHKDGDKFGNEFMLKGFSKDLQSFNWEIAGTGLSGRAEVSDNEFIIPVIISDAADSLMLLFFITGSESEKLTVSSLKLDADRNPPNLEIATPLPDSYYSDSISLKGKVLNKDNDDIDQIKELKWSIPGTNSLNNLVFFDDKGNFDIDIFSNDLSGPVALEITAEDFNGNINSSLIKLKDGKKQPVIELKSPSDGSSFGAFINISGRIVDPYSGFEYAGIKEASYSIVSSEDFNAEPLTGIIELSDSYSFDMQLPAIQIKENQLLTINADALNGSSVQKNIEIIKSSNDIPSFKLTAGSSSVTADWTPVETGAEYTLAITEAGQEPNDTENLSGTDSMTYTNINPPVKISGLKNGTLYQAVLKAVASAQDEGAAVTLRSGALSVIPYNFQTFNLVANDDFKKIRLKWKSINDLVSYNIYRSLEKTGEFRLLVSDYEKTEYIDKDVLFGKSYQYYITPANHDYAKSETVSAKMLSAPKEKIELYAGLQNLNPLNITVEGDYAFAACGDGGLYIIDITEPENLKVTGALKDIYCEAVTVRDEYAYIAGGSAGVSVINILNPAEPFIVGSRKTSNAVDIRLKDNIAYTADIEDGIRLIDISDSGAPARLSSVELSGTKVLTIENNLLFTNNGGNLSIFDISSTNNPELLTEIETNSIIDISTYNSNIYVLTEDKMLILDIADFHLLSETEIKTPDSICFSDDYCFVSQNDNGLTFFNITDPSAPKEVHNIRVNSFKAVDSYKNYLITSSEGRLISVQTFLKGSSFEINELPLKNRSVSMAVSEDSLFVSTKGAGIEVLNISRPAEALRPLQTIPSPDSNGVIAVSASRARLYTAETSEKLNAYSISREQNNISLSSQYSVEFPAPIIYANTETGNMTDTDLIVITEDGNINFVNNEGSYSSIKSEDPVSCIIIGQTAFISDSSSGLKAYDISRTKALELLFTQNVSNADFILGSENILALNNADGIALFDITDKSKPKQAGLIETGYAEKAVLRNKYLYVAEGYKGLNVYDISDPNAPVLISTCDTVYASDLVISDNYAYINNGTGISTVQIFIPEWLKD